MNDFASEALSAIKSNLEGLPSFCRLVMYELLEYCDYKSGIISINTLDDVAHDFRVAPSPGRKKEVINGDTLRNAFRTIKKAKPDHFKFTTKNQRIIIEMPFLSILYQQFFGGLNQVAAVSASEHNRATRLDPIEDSVNLDALFFGEDARDVAAATSCVVEDNINIKKQITKQTNSFESPRPKCPITDDFVPNTCTIAEATARGYINATNPNEIKAFIAYNKALQTRWADYNPVYLLWLARAEEHQQQKQQIKPIINSSRIRQHANTAITRSYGKTMQGVKNVLNSRFDFCEKTRRFYERPANHCRHSDTVAAAY